MDKINRYFLHGKIAVLSTIDVTMFPVPITGDIKTLRVSNEIITSVADEDLVLSTVTAGGVATAVTAGTMTIPDATAALETTTLEIAKHASTRVTAGGSIRLANDGECTSAGPAQIEIEITI